MKDIWQWLSEVDREIGPDHSMWRHYNQYQRARDADDAAGVQLFRDEVTGLAREHNLPWLEVFATHWYLQYRVAGREQGGTHLTEAVRAFEIAHRPENAECPQSICTAQDLCIAYGDVDGPGFAEERLAASRSTLERIDPTWPCYDCISSEIGSALLDAERYDEALALAAETQPVIRGEGALPKLDWPTKQLKALRSTGDLDAAVELVAQTDRSRFSRDTRSMDQHYDMERVILATLTGDHEGAREIAAAIPHPRDYSEVSAVRWSEMQRCLVEAGLADNDLELSRDRAQLVERYRANGAIWRPFLVCLDLARAAAERGAAEVAALGVEVATEIAAELRDQDLARRRLAEVVSILEAPEIRSEPTGLDEEWATIVAEGDGGAGADAEAVSRYADCMAAHGWIHRSERVLDAWLEANALDIDVALRLFGRLMVKGELAAVSALADRVESVAPEEAHWFRANVAARQQRWTDCIEHCRSILAADPTVANTRRLLIAAERQVGDFAAAAVVAAELLDIVGETPAPSDCWTAIVAGTLAEEWALVRRAAGHLDMELTGDEGPVEEQWGACLVTFVESEGRESTWMAGRTGPATARILSVGHHSRPQHHGDEVVFEPTPLDPPSDDPEDLQRYPHLLTRVEGGRRSFPLEGLSPGLEAWRQLRDALAQAGYAAWAYDVDPVVIDGEEQEVLYCQLAVGADASTTSLAELLDDLTADWPAAPSYELLAVEAGQAPDIHRQRLEQLYPEGDG